MNERTLIYGGILCAAMICSGAIAPIPAEADTRSANYAQIIASEEIRLDDQLVQQSAHDAWGTTIRSASGEICALTIENFRLRAALSVDGGILFGAEIDVAGGPGQPAVMDISGVMGPADAIYIALRVADPGGHHGLQFIRSTDFCETWSSPEFLVQAGDPTHGVTTVGSASNSSGRWAIYYHGVDGEDAYAITSDDGGLNWTAPVRVDDGPPPAGAPVRSGSIAVDETGVIYVAYVDLESGLPMTWYTRSTDGGLTFETSRRIGDVLPSTGGSNTNPQLLITADGSVLLAFWDSLPRLYVARSVDLGQNYTISYYFDLTDPYFEAHPVMFHGNGDVFLLAADETSTVSLHRSLDNGASFLFREYVTTDAYGVDAFSMARTAAGKWILAWTDKGADSYAGVLTDIYAKTSPNRGDTWSTAQRVNGDAPASARHWLRPSSLMPYGSADDFLITYVDDREDGNEIANLYGTRGTATPTSLTLSPDRRIDTDSTESISPVVAAVPVIATDGIDHVYVAFSANTTGPYHDLYVAVSGDGGYEFSTPVRVGDTVAGSAIEWLPALAALPDGHVWVAYLSDDPGDTGREIRLNRSTDYGATWEGDTIFGALDWPAGYRFSVDVPALQIAALPDGKVYVTASDGSDIYITRSTDFGASFNEGDDIDQDDRGQNFLPRICADGDQVVVVFVSPRFLDNSARSIWAVVSEDAGQTWGLSEELRPASRPGNIANGIDLACGPGGRALASWSDFPVVDPHYEIRSRLYDGSAWQGTDVAVPGDYFGVNYFWPSAAYTGGVGVVLAYQVTDYEIYTARSIDGGASWLSYTRMDDYNPTPDLPARSYWPQVVSDGGGNVWVSWLDTAAGRPSVVMRRSADSGASYFLTTLLDRQEPQGAFDSLIYPTFASSASLSGVGFVARAALRDTPVSYDVVLNGWDRYDYDRDTSPDTEDCNFLDPGAFAVPGEVVGPAISKSVAGDSELIWNSLASTAGNGTTYDIVSGRLSDLFSMGTFVSASCLQNDLNAASYTDIRADPPAGDAHYYLVRGQNSCGIGSFGDSSQLPDPRDDLEGYFTPCP